MDGCPAIFSVVSGGAGAAGAAAAGSGTGGGAGAAALAPEAAGAPPGRDAVGVTPPAQAATSRASKPIETGEPSRTGIGSSSRSTRCYERRGWLVLNTRRERHERQSKGPQGDEA